MSFRNRKGAMAVMVALMLMLLLTFVAYVVDFSKIFVMRNELHTSADAATLAAAVAWTKNGGAGNPTPAYSAAVTAANGLADSNRVLNVKPTVEAVTTGNWDEAAATFSPGAAPLNAIQVWTRQATNYLLGGVSQMGQRQIRAAATVWTDAPVSQTPCTTPWSVPYESLTVKIDPTNPDLARDITQAEVDELVTRPISERTITLKLGAPPDEPGNFYPIQFPVYYRAVDGTYLNPVPGANRYGDLLRPCEDIVPAALRDSATAGVGDSLEVQPGNIVQKTIDGAQELMGRPIVIPLNIGSSLVRGQSELVSVKMLAGFEITEVTRQGQSGSLVRGYFRRVESTGRISNGPSMVRTQILVQ